MVVCMCRSGDDLQELILFLLRVCEFELMSSGLGVDKSCGVISKTVDLATPYKLNCTIFVSQEQLYSMWPVLKVLCCCMCQDFYF